MLLKWIAHRWASSNLRKEEVRTQRLLSEYDSLKATTERRIANRKSDYQYRIKQRQETLERELTQYIEFMNTRLEAASGYMLKLDQFQTFTLTCVDSWIKVDLLQQEINIYTKKIEALFSTICLLDAYISELTKLAQRQGRHVWREMTNARPLTVDNAFVDRQRQRIDKGSKLNHEEFRYEHKRLASHRDALYKEVKLLIDERKELHARKSEVEVVHNANKKTLEALYDVCCEQWKEMLRAFETYYSNTSSESAYVNQWMMHLKEGGTLREIVTLLGTAHEMINCANETFAPVKDEYYAFKAIIQKARQSNEYASDYSTVKVNYDKLKPIAKDCWELSQARTVLYSRRDELRGYIENLKKLHPDEVLDTLYVLLKEERDVNTWQAFGINTQKQRIEYHNKQKGVPHGEG